MAHQIIAAEPEKLRVVSLRFLSPRFKRRRVTHFIPELLVIESEDVLIIHQHVRPAALLLEIADFMNQRLIMLEERRLRFKLSLYQSFADKDLAGQFRVMLRIGHGAASVNGKSV